MSKTKPATLSESLINLRSLLSADSGSPGLGERMLATLGVAEQAYGKGYPGVAAFCVFQALAEAAREMPQSRVYEELLALDDLLQAEARAAGRAVPLSVEEAADLTERLGPAAGFAGEADFARAEEAIRTRRADLSTPAKTGEVHS